MIRKIISFFTKKSNKYKDIISELRERGVKIGENVDIINAYIDGCHGFLITIGNNVTITNATILAHDASTKKIIGYTKVGRVDIGDNVFIGFGAIVLPGTKIGSNVIIGAGSVIAKDIPDNSVVIGNPCRVVCSFDEYIEKNKSQLNTNPTYNTIFYNKTKEEKDLMYKELTDTIGYDL